MAQIKEEVFSVEYNDESCKIYAIDVLNVIGFVANNDGESGLKRKVSVHVRSDKELKTAQKILQIFAKSVTKEPRKFAFKVTFHDNNKARGLKAVRGLPGVESAVERRVKRGHDATKYSNAPLILDVVGTAESETVLRTLQEYGNVVPN